MRNCSFCDLAVGKVGIDLEGRFIDRWLRFAALGIGVKRSGQPGDAVNHEIDKSEKAEVGMDLL